MAATAYDKCLENMFGMRRFGIKLGLDVIAGVLDGIGNPHTRFRSIHVAGTNGKGSVAASLATILRRAGYRVGLYTSPHLVRFNERIEVDGDPIADEAVVEAHRAVSEAFSGDREPTFFEFATAMAFYEFGRRNVDFAVVETGMGGRLDATNIIQPELGIITNISLEHREYLGNSIAAIAGEKAGIIKAQTPVVTGVTQPVAWQVIRQTAEARQAPLFRLGEAFTFRRNGRGGLHYHGMHQRFKAIAVALKGDHQLANAAITLAACEILDTNGIAAIDEAAIRTGLLETRWPGRLEVVSHAPTVILDGAHNLSAAKRLSGYLKKTYADRRIILVIGILSDKPYRRMLKDLLSVSSQAIVTRPRIDRALEPEVLHAAAGDFIDRVTIAPDVETAIRTAAAIATAEDVICIAGSLYVVGEAKAALRRLSGERPDAVPFEEPQIF